MKIREVHAKVYRWIGPTTPPRRNLSASPMDALIGLDDSMGSFRFHEWLVCEVMSNEGLVGIGNCALAPAIAKAIIDRYLAPLVVGRDPFTALMRGERQAAARPHVV